MSTIVFRVNLETVDNLTSKQPYNQYDSTVANNFRATRITWFPDILRDNRELNHGDTFTVHDANAQYLKRNFTSGEFKFLDIVTETAP